MSSPNLDFQAERIGHLLADRWLEVPAYQRAYAWEDEHVGEYWNDLTDSLEDERQYFLGAVVVTRGESRDFVIDGQQRLATTTLLLAAVRDELQELGEEELANHVQARYLATYNPDARALEPRFQVIAADRDFYAEQFIRRAGGEPRSASQRRLVSSFRLLRKKIADLSADANQLMALVNHLEDSVLVVLVEAASEADAFQIFETLNDRGAPLTIADLLKNYLISLSPGRAEEIAASWDYATSNLGADAETDDFVTFIRHYWSSLEGATRERDLYRSLRRSITDREMAVDFAEDVAGASEWYAALLDAGHPVWAEYPELAARSVKTLLFLQLGQYRPLLLAATEIFNPSELARLAEALVCWNVRGLIVGGIGGGTTERAYASAAVGIRSGDLLNTSAVFDHLRPIIANDEEFRKSFESAVLPRARIAQYIMRSINRSLSGMENPAIDEDDSTAVTTVPLLHRHADPTEWAAFAPEEISRETNRIGNLFLRPSGRSSTPAAWRERSTFLLEGGYVVNEYLVGLDYWSPTHVRHRQQDLAAIALRTWPRAGHP